MPHAQQGGQFRPCLLLFLPGSGQQIDGILQLQFHGMQFLLCDDSDGSLLTCDGQHRIVQTQFFLAHHDQSLSAQQAEVAHGGFLGNASQVVLMLLAGSLQPLVLHLLLPSEGVIAQQAMAIAHQQRSGHELPRIASGLLTEELTPDGLCAHVCLAAKWQHLLAELQLGRGREDVEVAQIDVVAGGVADDVRVVGHKPQRELGFAQGFECLVGCLPALVLLPALEGSDSTILCQVYHLVEGQRCLPPCHMAEKWQKRQQA